MSAVVAVFAPLDKPLSYEVPAALREQVAPGVRVRVPLGNRRALGVILELASAGVEGLRPVEEVLDLQPLLSSPMLAFLRRAAAYYHHPLGEVLRAALPAGLTAVKTRVNIVTERFYRAACAVQDPPGARQREILAWLRGREEVPLSEISRHFPAPHAVLKRLVELNLLSVREGERRRDPFLDQPVPVDVRPVLGVDQQQALAALLDALAAGRFAQFLLHGVTGSGKTEIYLHAIAAVLEQGRQALVLVPEIALTPQLVARFRTRFQAACARVAVLHSALSEGERYDAWRAIARGEVQIVIGARSAVFAPLPDLGIVVVDEEHESGYKQSEGWRYHARDLALLRAQGSAAVVVLGSATPALTTFYRTQAGDTGYLSLDARVLGRPLPEVELVDLGGRRLSGALAPELMEALSATLERKEQALLLLNRRGFAPYLLCRECGATFRCPNCEITLTYYQSRRRLRCHYCDYVQRPPERCSGCGGTSIEPEGAGTERLEEELAVAFPVARIARMDRDTTSRKGAHQSLVDGMEQGAIDILIGTQMVAKGHDFPRVTLVGVIGADSSLNFPDFRSAERTFALLTQVAGRAGRGTLQGRVLIQTYAPTHHALACAARHDYLGFYEQEIAFRRELGYPPFGYLINLVLAGNQPLQVERCAAELAEELSRKAGEVEILGPAPCPLARLRGKTRYQILLKAAARAPLHRLLGVVDSRRRKLPRTLSLAVDVDPLDML
ncbi:primosomal protein N' [Geoalkalibacter ferrihydriticus DSM 17813]|uniref:Replication restart protein PriA n=1 Tax=Geoalkalibacter ferrihydriticus DSM 17813 TaxID=1121915 RepID=A0A0C2ECB2_9BACT|nr:primosomal protein N' [Geoalkalibacter ferrihydriticus DSM 17813]